MAKIDTLFLTKTAEKPYSLVAEQDQKLFNIFQINDFFLGKASLKYATEVMHALRQAEGHLKFSVKRAQIREVVYRQSRVALFNHMSTSCAFENGHRQMPRKETLGASTPKIIKYSSVLT